MYSTIYSNNDFRSYALYHHGVLGQKWGVRRYQNYDGTLTAKGRKRVKPINNKDRDRQIRAINSMYDHANKWTNRKIEKLDKKGKTAKADVMRVMAKKNEEARKEKIDNLNKMTTQKQLNKSRNQDRLDALFGGQDWMKNNSANMTSFLSRVNEYDMQRGMRWMSNFTRNSTLARMTPEEGYEYLRRKNIQQRQAQRNANYA